MPETIGSSFEVNVPTLSDNASIVEAFRLYHYGISSEPASPSDILNTSIEGHLTRIEALAQAASTAQAVVAQLGSEDLDSLTESKTWHKLTTPGQNLGYPVLAPGLLTVINSGEGPVYQTYRTIGGTVGSNLNQLWWRGKSASANDWSTWFRPADINHTHDALYYSKTDLDSKIDDISRSSVNKANKAIVSDSNGKLTYSTNISSTEINYLDGASSNIQSQLNNRYTKDETVRVFVQDSAGPNPVGATEGDLWFW